MQLTQNAIILGKFYPEGTELECTTETAEVGYKAFERALIRQKIDHRTGFDDGSLIGITSDGVHVLTYAVATLYHAIANASSLKDLKTQTEKFAPIAADFLQKVEDGEIKLPYLANEHKGGVAGVFASVATAANGTTEALAEVKS